MSDADVVFSELTKTVTGLDEAIAEEEKGEVFYYDSVDEMFADIKNE